MKNSDLINEGENVLNQNRKRKCEASDSKKEKKNSSFSPWWDSRKKELASQLPIAKTLTQPEKISWIMKQETMVTKKKVTFDPNKVKIPIKKKVKKLTSLTKKVLGEDETIRAFKIAVLPTQNQIETFQKMFGVVRFIYNHSLDKVRQGFNPKFEDIRNSILRKNDNPLINKYPWIFDRKLIPREVIEMAVQELVSAYHASAEGIRAKEEKKKSKTKTNKKKTKSNDKKQEKEKTGPDMQYRKKKDEFQRFHITNHGKPGVIWKKNGFCFWPRKKLGILLPKYKKDYDKIKRLLPNGSEYTTILKYETPGRYYLIFPYAKKKEESNSDQNLVALDPGVRTFQTAYDSRGKFIEYGTGSIKKIMRKCYKLDGLQSKIDQEKKDFYDSRKEKMQYKYRRRKYRRKYQLLQHRIQRQLKDIHWKMARELSENYKYIMISRFKVSEMIQKTERKIKTDTVRKMLNWRHYLFRQRLISKAEEFGTIVHEVSEHYTSKTCGKCGRVDWKLGGKKEFKCPNCGFSIARDRNGARNIFLMNVENCVGRIEISNPPSTSRRG